MDRDQQQGQRAIEQGFVSPEQVRLAYQSPRRSPNHDLCALLLEHSLISLAQAQMIRLPQPGPSHPSTALDSDSALTATFKLPGASVSQLTQPRGPQSAVPSGSSGRSMQSAQAQRRAQIIEAFEQEHALDPLFAPHADLVLERKEQLGVGGMGEVYRVFDKRLGRHAALKILRQDKESKERLSRFLREGEITARLEHPAIPPVYEAGTNSAGQHYILMKVIEGQSLGERIRAIHKNERPAMELLRPLLEAMIPVCEAIAYAHNQGILHRDLKPDNIMLGEFGEVMVMDWGIARDLNDDRGSLESLDAIQVEDSELEKEGLTLDGAVIGTPGYMPPEQANGQSVSPGADVFALGAILTTILTGAGPVRGATPFKLIVSTIKGEIESPRDRHPGVPKALNAIVEKALHPQLSERFTSVEDLSRELKAYLAGMNVSVYRYSLGERLTNLLGRSPGLVLGLFAGTLMLAISGVLGVQTYNTQLREDDAKRLKETFEKRLKRLETSQKNFALALDLARRGARREEVRETIRLALENSDRSLDQLLFAARIYEEGKLYREALALLNEATERYPPAYQALYAIHKLTTRQNLSTGFASTEALEKLIRLAKERGESNEYTLLSDGIEKHNQQKYEEAIRIFDKIQSSTKNHKMMFTFRGASNIALERFDRAFVDLNRALSHDPLDATALHYRGICYERSQDDDNAFDDFSRSLKLRPDQATLYVRRGLIWERKGKLDNALQDIERAIALNPKNPEYYKNKGALLVKNGQANQAIPAFDTMLSLAPNNLFYLEMRAKNSIICSNYDQAQKDLQRIIELDPKNAEAYLTRGSLYSILSSGESKEKAILDFTKSIELREHNIPAYLGRAQVYSGQGKHNKALVDLNIAISIDKEKYEAYFARALCHANLAQNKECIADLKFVYRRAPKDHPSRKQALNVLYKMRDPEVMADFQKGLKAMKKLGSIFGKKKDSAKKDKP